MNKRVFLVGCPRSGTTLLQVMLGSHSAIASFPESHFFRVMLKRRPVWRKALGLGNRETAQRLQSFLAEVPDAPNLRCGKVLPTVKHCSNAFYRLLDKIASDRGKQLWVEKTPDHVLFVDQIQALVPESKFVHLVRDGREVVASLYEVTAKHPAVWGSPWSVEKCIDHWLLTVERSLSCCHATASHILVRYGNLKSNPEIELRKISGFLDIKYETEMLNRPAEKTIGAVSDGEIWKANVYSKNSPQALEKFHNLFSQDQQNFISERVERLNLRVVNAASTHCANSRLRKSD